MTYFTVLDQAEEDKLHATRLLGIEERPFKRLTKRLLGPNTPIQSYLRRTPAGKAEAEEDGDRDEGDAIEVDTSENDDPQTEESFLRNLARFREDVILDFAAFESSIVRIQFLRAANDKERERYAAEKLKIEATASEVRDSTASLRVRLDEAQKMLAIRKTYDVLAEDITRDVSLKPRDEQAVNIEKLKVEIEELEKETLEHETSWRDRREQVDRLVAEGMRLRRLIRDEKEPEHEDEAEEKKEGDEEDGAMLGVDRDRDHGSNMGSPPPAEDVPTPLPAAHESGAMTPRSDAAKDGKHATGGGDTEMIDD